MGGICGIYCPSDPASADPSALNAMLDAIAHRGVAGRHSFVDGEAGIAIGHVFSSTFQNPTCKPVPNWYKNDRYYEFYINNNDNFFYPGDEGT